ncbi:MAG: SurA N-terminal domain-containing protein [Desulfobacterales bacterium]
MLTAKNLFSEAKKIVILKEGCVRLSMNRFETCMLLFFIGVCLFILAAAGCSGSKSGREGGILIRVGDQIVTDFDFNKAFEISSAEYPHQDIQDAGIVRKMKLRLLNQLIEEMILLQKAKELQIVVSDSEMDKTVNEIKKDYPENEFEQTFLENAVSYDTWKNRLKNRMLMEKVVASEIRDRVVITKEDISKHYQESATDKNPGSDLMNSATDINEIVIQTIRREKAEKEYKSWIKNIRKEYKVEINKELWEKILGQGIT